jgi:hypothetical protein
MTRSIILDSFRRFYAHIQLGHTIVHIQGFRRAIQLGFLHFEEEASMFWLDTLVGGFNFLDLSLGGVWKHLGKFIFSREEPLLEIIFSRSCQHQQGRTSCLRVGLKP